MNPCLRPHRKHLRTIREENFGVFRDRTYVDVLAISKKRGALYACANPISHLFSSGTTHKEKDGLKRHDMDTNMST